MTRKKQYLSILFILLMFYVFFGFVFTHVVVFTSSLLIYFCFLGISFLFFGYVICYHCLKLSTQICFVLLYVGYTIAGYILAGRIENACWWGVCACLLLIAYNYSEVYLEAFPYKAIFAIGVFCSVGIFFELLFPSLYDNYVAPLFIERDLLITMRRVSGFAGFTYQLDTSSMPIIFAFFILLYKNKEKTKRELFLLLLFIIAVVLAGKRILIMVILLVPIIVFLLMNKNLGKKAIVLLLGVLLLYGAYLYLVHHAASLQNTVFLRRFARMILDANSGLDITSGRNDLYASAIQYFKTSPIFGIGVGSFALLEETDVHNTFLQVLCEQGVVGALLFSLPIVSCLVKSVEFARSTNERNQFSIKFAIAVQLVYILYSFTGNLNTNLFGFVIYYSVLGLFFAMRQNTLNHSSWHK